jgi:hypothetical protein
VEQVTAHRFISAPAETLKVEKDWFNTASAEAGVYRFGATDGFGYNGQTVAGDRATQECDPSTVAVPYSVDVEVMNE